MDNTTVSVITYVARERAGQSDTVDGQAVIVAVRVLKTVEMVNGWLSSGEVVVWLATGTLVKVVDFEHLRVVGKPPVELPLVALVGGITSCDVLSRDEMMAEEEALLLGFLTPELHEGRNGTAELERMADGTAEDETLAEEEIRGGTAEELAVTEDDTTVLELARDTLVEDIEIAVGVTVAVVQEVVTTPSLI